MINPCRGCRICGLPRTARASLGGICNHLTNRGTGRGAVFHKGGDYQALVQAIAPGCIEVSLRVLGYCLMPNPFPRVVWPQKDGELSQWMHGMLNTPVGHYHEQDRSNGHIPKGVSFYFVAGG